MALKTFTAAATSGSEAETQRLAAALAELLRPGDVVCLYGELGAGKTYFAKGLVTGLGGEARAVTSPTFVLLQTYEVRQVPPSPATPSGLPPSLRLPASPRLRRTSRRTGRRAKDGQKGRRLTVSHFDAYRLKSAQELVDIGSDEILCGEGISIIEWADHVAQALPAERLEVHLASGGETVRRLRFVGRGARPAKCVAELAARRLVREVS